MKALLDQWGQYRLPGNSARFTGILAAAVVLALLANLALPSDTALHVDNYTINLLGKYLCFALLALSVDVIWGYCGILSLGHGAFFALGGYAMGMYLMRQTGGSDELPDFMGFLGWEELPWYWFGMDHFSFAMLMIFVAPGLLAFVFGWLAFRSRVSGVYFSIITQAMTYALMLAFFRNEMGFGGNNGLTDFDTILGFDVQAETTRRGLFIASALVLGIAYCLSSFIVNSRLGKVVTAVRDSEPRTRFLGYRTQDYKLWLFVYSAMLAGLAGALYVPQVGIINPSEFSPLNSIEIVVWVAVGGRGTLYGAVIGAVLVNYAQTRFTSLMPESWTFMLGALFVLVTIYLPGGLAGMARQKLQTRKALRDNARGQEGTA